MYICGKNALSLERSENFVRLCMGKWPFFSAILFCRSFLRERKNATPICSCAGRSSTNEYNFKDCVNFRKIAYDAYDAYDAYNAYNAYNAYDEASKNLTEHC